MGEYKQFTSHQLENMEENIKNNGYCGPIHIIGHS